MRITVLAENTTCREDVTAQHGLSLYIETAHQNILFDMGQDDTFARNAQALQVDLAQADLAVLSHGHYDHGGGLETFLQINHKAPVYLHEEAFGAYYNGTEKYIGLDRNLRFHNRLVFVKGSCRPAENLHLTDCNHLQWHSNSWGLTRKEEDTFLPDAFCHEQYLQIEEGNKRILISGCSHKGILNIARHFRPDVLIGGFHLNKETDIDSLRQTAETLLTDDTVYYTGHCTGSRQFAVMKEIMGSRLQSLSTGLVFEA